MSFWRNFKNVAQKYFNRWIEYIIFLRSDRTKSFEHILHELSFFIYIEFYLKCDNAFAQESVEILLIFVKVFFCIYHAIKFFAIEFRAVLKAHWQNENFIEHDENTEFDFFIDFCFSPRFSQKNDSTSFRDFVDLFL